MSANKTSGPDATAYNPDVLSCLANLSNDEVFTPPEVVNAMLDLLPQKIFKDPNAKFLDPACKSGVFLREIAKRLLIGLEQKIPDLQERVNHIFTKQLYAIAITELTSLLSRRSVYCSKDASGKYSITKFKQKCGNIFYAPTKHLWIDGKCLSCGASQSEYGEDVRQGLESHAYQFIHDAIPGEIRDMKFDVIIGNPPYQLSDGGGGAGKSAMPIYQLFVQQAKKLQPRYLTMIIPSRWFSGGKGLDQFRDDMLNDNHLIEIVDYSDSKTCFPSGVDIPGGICYFLWAKDKKSLCKVTNISKDGRKSVLDRKLNEFSTLIRYNDAVSIVKKITAKEEKFLSSIVSSRKPFGLDSNTVFDKNGDVILKSSKGLGKICKNKILLGKDLINKWKVIISKVSFEHAGVPDREGMMRVISVLQVLPPNSCCTESYLVVKTFDNEIEANNMISFLKTKLARFLMMQMLASMNMTKNTFTFVPMQDFSKPWTDQELYKKYNLSQEEIDFIESMIRPMPEETD